MSGAIRPALFRRLIRKFGRRDAERQLRWLNVELLSSARQNRPSLTGLLSRLLRDEPLAYVIGSQPFGSLNLRVAPPVLIPRPETEEWTYELLNRLRSQESGALTRQKDWRILDLCTGSGCIPLLLCKEWPNQLSGKISAYGVDIGEEAIALARRNASQTLGNVISSVRSFQPTKFDIFSREFSEWVSEVGGFDVITSNPPYIPQKDWELLPTSVKSFEDPLALQGGEDGLVFYRRIAELLKTMPLLKPRGWLAVEFGIDQAPAVQRIFQETGILANVDVWTDCFGIQRTIFCQARRT